MEAPSTPNFSSASLQAFWVQARKQREHVTQEQEQPAAHPCSSCPWALAGSALCEACYLWLCSGCMWNVSSPTEPPATSRAQGALVWALCPCGGINLARQGQFLEPWHSTISREQRVAWHAGMLAQAGQQAHHQLSWAPPPRPALHHLS